MDKFLIEGPVRLSGEVTISGAVCRRLLLKNCSKFYTMAIDSYLAEKLLARA